MKYEYTCGRCEVKVVDAERRILVNLFLKDSYRSDLRRHKNYLSLIRLREKYKEEYEKAVYIDNGPIWRVLGAKDVLYCERYGIDEYLLLKHPEEYVPVSYVYESKPWKDDPDYNHKYLLCPACAEHLDEGESEIS